MNQGAPIIIGAGPAGLGTAIQLKRYGISPLVLERESIGGLLRNANLVENYPGFPAGIPGVELVQLLKKHARASGVEVILAEVKRSHSRMDFSQSMRVISSIARRSWSLPPVQNRAYSTASKSRLHFKREYSTRFTRC